MDMLKGANRLIGFDKPTVWSIMTPLAVETKSINLGQGFPTWGPPDFYVENLTESTKNANHQYVRSYGSLSFIDTIAKYHSNSYKNINPETDIVTVKGGVEGLYCCFMGLVNEGEEVIVFDPSYDCYRPQVQMAGGTVKGVLLKPKKQQSKADLLKRCADGFVSNADDDWEIDFEGFEKAINPKTKVLLLNSPHNPVGKVFTQEELEKLAAILKKHPQIIVVEDSVYEDMQFDDMMDKPLPKMAFVEGMYHRCLGVYSAGKIFCATGVRSGWVIGPAHLIKFVRSVHQYNVFCPYNVLQNTVGKSLQTISKPENTYMHDYASRLQKMRNVLLQKLIESKYDFDLWIPKGGYFVLADISRIEVNPKYLKDTEGNPRTKDYAFAYELAYEKGVVAIPCSPFYDKEDYKEGERFVRFAFCKDEAMIEEAGKKLQ